MSKLSIAIAMTAAGLLSACGNAEPPKAAAPPPVIENGIYTSTGDCVDGGKLTAEKCEKAIDMAVSVHESSAPIFKTKRQCEAATGPERCGKTVDGRYRPLLQAFFVVMSTPPSAQPLYPSTAQQIGFQSLTKQVIFADDESLLISNSAITLAHENAKLPANDTTSNAGEGLGAAAADIH